MSSEITFIVTYACPRCHAALEARSGDSQTWLRCPKCGRASLPPEHMRTPPRTIDPPGDDVLIIAPGLEPPELDPTGSSRARTYPGKVPRIVLGTGLLLSLTMLMISFLDQDIAKVSAYGALSIVLFAFLGLSSLRR